MKFQKYYTWLFWVIFVCFTTCCDQSDCLNPKLIFFDGQGSDSAIKPDIEESFVFRDGVQVFPKSNTLINRKLLTERDNFATTLTDPYKYLWTISTAVGLTDQDFANAGLFMSSRTNDNSVFYYGKINTWEISADCVAYVAASEHDFVVIRRNQDQGACPTAAGYAAWLPRAEITQKTTSQGVHTSGLTAYGANNHQNNIVHGVFNDVKVYGNDPYGWLCTDFQLFSHCLAYAGIRLTGTKWDSAEFVSRYFITRYNHSPMWQGPAKYWYQNGYGLKKMHNCGSVPPQTGDMLVSEGGSHGHAAIVREVSDHSITVIQQNWFESEKDNSYFIPMTAAGNHHCVSDFGEGYPVVGWLRE